MKTKYPYIEETGNQLSVLGTPNTQHNSDIDTEDRALSNIERDGLLNYSHLDPSRRNNNNEGQEVVKVE